MHLAAQTRKAQIRDGNYFLREALDDSKNTLYPDEVKDSYLRERRYTVNHANKARRRILRQLSEEENPETQRENLAFYERKDYAPDFELEYRYIFENLGRDVLASADLRAARRYDRVMTCMRDELKRPNERTMEATGEAYDRLFKTEEDEVSEARKRVGFCSACRAKEIPGILSHVSSRLEANRRQMG